MGGSGHTSINVLEPSEKFNLTWNASLGKYDARPVTSRSRRNRLFIFYNYFKHTALRSVAGAGFDAISGKDPYAHRSA